MKKQVNVRRIPRRQKSPEEIEEYNRKLEEGRKLRQQREEGKRYLKDLRQF